MGTDADANRWDCPPHTKAKHAILASYLDGWYPVLASWNGRVVFLDGFAGRGRYNDGSEGSPLIALRHLVDHRNFPKMAHREFVFLFVEADAENAASLSRELDNLRREKAPWPDNVQMQVIHDKFDATAKGILDELREQKANLAPTFAFVDPFGYSGLSMDLLADLMSYPRTELFVNFMVGHVQRFITRDGQERPMASLFGMDVTELLAQVAEEGDRIEQLRRLYERQLRDRAGFAYVQSFAMINSTGNIGYYLFHGTRHRLGVKLMKAAMWKVDPAGAYTFSDRLAGREVLFTLEPDLGPLESAMLSRFQGSKNVLVEDLEWFAVLETPYRETHLRPVLKRLELGGLLRVRRPGKAGFPATKTYVDFI